jgi:acyl-coenzyme A synthetase/AMP-(fatty) acid ligase
VVAVSLKKKVEVTHRSLVNLLLSVRRTPGFAASDVLPAVTTLSFDIAGVDVWLPLVCGGRTVVASPDDVLDGRRLRGLISEAGATFMQATPATWRLLLQAGWAGESDLRILSTGEALPRDLANGLVDKGLELWNLYGPTETTIWSTAGRVDDGEGPVSIGRPIANTQVFVLDRALKPVPIGVPGDLYIGGVGLARGYRALPELTAERFVPNPFDSRPTTRLYATGDRARFLRDGHIEFLGRADNQVKVRGFRIELGEVEAALASHPGIGQAVACVTDDLDAGRRLVGYFVPREEATPTGTEVRRFLKARLPDYMIPSFLVEIDRVPLTPNGKLDRKALPDPLGDGAPAEAHAAEPRTQTEIAVAAIWREALKVGRVGLHDNFFDLGGHSLLSLQVLARIEREFKRRLHPRVMIVGTLEQVANACDC